jgi:hypothetical protein
LSVTIACRHIFTLLAALSFDSRLNDRSLCDTYACCQFV